MVRHRAVCANVRNQTTGAACGTRPLALLPHGAPQYGPPVAHSVAPGRCNFVVAGFARLPRCTVAPVFASVCKQMTGAACALWPLVILPHGVPPQGPPLARSVAPSRCISKTRQLLAKESVETWVCSPATVRHRAVYANVRNWTTGAACATRPLALLPHGAPPHGPPVARSVAPGCCNFVVAGFARLPRRTVAPVFASVRKRVPLRTLFSCCDGEKRKFVHGF